MFIFRSRFRKTEREDAQTNGEEARVVVSEPAISYLLVARGDGDSMSEETGRRGGEDAGGCWWADRWTLRKESDFLEVRMIEMDRAGATWWITTDRTIKRFYNCLKRIRNTGLQVLKDLLIGLVDLQATELFTMCEYGCSLENGAQFGNVRPLIIYIKDINFEHETEMKNEKQTGGLLEICSEDLSKLMSRIKLMTKTRWALIMSAFLFSPNHRITESQVWKVQEWDEILENSMLLPLGRCVSDAILIREGGAGSMT